MKNLIIADETIIWNKVQNNMTQTQAEAPFLGMVQPRGTITFPQLMTAVKENGCSESELEITRAMRKQEELLKNYAAQNYKVYTPYGYVWVHITKSFPAQDAQFNTAVNEAIMALQTNDETRNALKGVAVKEDTEAAAKLKGPKINSVCTGGTQFGVIVGTQKFVIAGSGLTLDKTKTTDKLTLTNDKTGTVTDVTNYTCDGEGFRIETQLGAALAAGKYTLTAYVDEGDEANPNVLSATAKVTVEAA